MNSSVKEYKHVIVFYVLSTIIPWAFWYVAGNISHSSNPNPNLVTFLGIIGLSSPMLVAFWLMFKNPNLKNDFWGRFFNFKGIKPIYIFLSVFLMLASILLAQAISLLFGYSASQFSFANHFSFSSGILPVWFLLILAPLIEELAWHSYGTDALRNKFNLLATSVIFAFYWGIWHIPLSLIKNYYQSNLVATGWIHSVNFLLSIFPFVIIMNWLYYKTGRNILIAIVFHISAGFFNEVFNTHVDTKVIQTIILLIFAIYIVIKDRNFFLAK